MLSAYVPSWPLIATTLGIPKDNQTWKLNSTLSVPGPLIPHILDGKV